MLGAMDAKDKANRITSISTFKPPPRVTLTEQKKEAWLRDLANPAVPLRRLSRTIPHGTRNRSLLEQCTNKSIPITRAVWFVRCVGANELRGLKRKGSSQVGPVTEAQWVHEWTDQVTEYIEKVVKECNNTTANNTSNTSASAAPQSPSAGSPNPQKGKSTPKPYGSPSAGKLTPHSHSSTTTQIPWKSKMEYIVRLSASLFSEGLLDRPLFLKWTVMHFQRCKLDELPVALLFLRLFWQDILQSGMLSQTLALALLERYSQLSAPHFIKHATFASVRDKVCEHLQCFFLLSPDSFVMPNQWKDMGPIISDAFKGFDSDLTQRLLDLTVSRNESLVVTDASTARAAFRSPQFLVIDALDKIRAPYNWTPLGQCIHVNKIPEHEALQTAFQWATTRHRTGVDRVYICASLLTELADTLKWNISAAFSEFLEGITNLDDHVFSNVYDLMTECLDRDWFQPSTYFRKIISQGSLFTKKQPMSTAVQVQVRILENMPVQFSPSLKNQQVMLLKSLKSGVNQEKDSLRQAQTTLSARLDFLVANVDSATEYYELPPGLVDCVNSLSKGSQAELSSWLLGLLDGRLRAGLDLTTAQFAALQTVMELLRDYKGLYCVIEALVPHIANGMLLAYIATTVRDHLAIFAAIADLAQLVQLMVAQYKGLKAKPKKSKALWELASYALAQTPEANTQLRAELEAVVTGPAAGQTPLRDIATLSPMSDGVVNEVGGNQDFGLLLQEHLGTQDNIDSRSLPKLFALVSQKLLDVCKSEGSCEDLRKIVLVLQHLRDFDNGVFTALVTKWIRDQVEPALYYDTAAFTRVLLFLVIYECLTLEKAGDIFLQLLSVNKLPGGTQTTKLMLSLFGSEYFQGIDLKAGEKLALTVQRRQFEQAHAAVYLKYIYQDMLDSANEGIPFVVSPPVHSFLLALTTADLGLFVAKFVDPLLDTGNATVKQDLKQIFVSLLQIDHASQTPRQEILHILDVFNFFNLPLFQVYVRVVLSCFADTAPNPDAAVLGVLLETLAGAQTSGANARVLGDLMVYLPAEVKAQLATKCELLFVTSGQFPLVVNMDTGEGNIAAYIYEVIDAVAVAAPGETGQVNLLDQHGFEVTQALDKLVAACEQFKPEVATTGDDSAAAGTEADADVDMTTDEPRLSAADLRTAVLLFAKLVQLHSPRLASTASAKASHHDSLRDKLTAGLVRVLGSEFVAGRLELYRAVMEAVNAVRAAADEGAGSAGADEASRPGTAATATSAASLVAASQPDSASIGTGTAAGGTSIFASIPPAALAALASQPAFNLPLTKRDLLPLTPGSSSDTTAEDSDAYLADLVMFNTATKKYSALPVRNFDLLEEGSHTMAANDVPVNLAMFDCVVERRNPA